MNIKENIKKTAAELLWMSKLSRPWERAGSSLYIITFHRVLPSELLSSYPHPELAVTPGEFSELLDIFSKWFTLVRLDTAVPVSADGKDAIPRAAITFDDGQLDNYRYAAPILDEKGIPATFFIPYDAVDRQELLWHDRMGFAIQKILETNSDSALLKELAGIDTVDSRIMKTCMENAKKLDHPARMNWIAEAENRFGTEHAEWTRLMTWKEVKDLASRGHEIGSHSFSHTLLDQCSIAELEVEIVQTRENIAKKTGEPVHTFCYPNGNFNKPVVEMTKNAGYTAAVSTLWGYNTPDTDPFALKRFDMNISSIVDQNSNILYKRLAMKMAGFLRGVEKSKSYASHI